MLSTSPAASAERSALSGSPSTPADVVGLEPVEVGTAAELALPCRAADPELFFAESPADVEAAKALCQPCPLREACLAGALERREPWGVWGGQLVLRGVVVPRKRPRGRPRKADSLPAAEEVAA